MLKNAECFIVMNVFICIFIVMKPSSDCKETYQLQKNRNLILWNNY